MLCPKCGYNNKKGAKVCASCKSSQISKKNISEAQVAAMMAEKEKQQKQSFIIRCCIAGVVLVAAVVICLLILKYDSNPDRDVLHGTYMAEQRYVFTTESGSDISGVHETFSVVFCEDGRMVLRYKSGTQTSYYSYSEKAPAPYDGVVTAKRYEKSGSEGTSFVEEIMIDRSENGDVVMYFTADSVTFTVPELVTVFGEEMTMSMLAGMYEQNICEILVAGNYDLITDEQLAAMGLKRESLADMSFAVKSLPVVLTAYRISDEELYKKEAESLWNELTAVSDTDTVSESDAGEEDDDDISTDA